MSKGLGVFLLSYQRPEFIQESIESILSQDFADFELVVSENSPGSEVMAVLSKYSGHSNFKVIKRSPSLPALNHFNTLIAESKKYEFAMFFHDDDLLMPGALKEMTAALRADSNCSAVGCNALLIKNREHTDMIFNPFLKSKTVIKTQSQLVNRYIFKRLSHTPFPGYIYRTKFLDGLELDPKDGGKYSDVSFLVKLVKRGNFIWLSEPLMKYRQHPSNDSAALNLLEIKSLSVFFLKTNPFLLPQISFYFLKQVVKKFFL